MFLRSFNGPNSDLSPKPTRRKEVSFDPNLSKDPETCDKRDSRKPTHRKDPETCDKKGSRKPTRRKEISFDPTLSKDSEACDKKDYSYPEASRGPSQNQNRRLVGEVCKSIRDFSLYQFHRKLNLRLKLILGNDRLWQVTPSPSTHDVEHKDLVSLKELIKSRLLTRVKPRDKYVLEVILANALMQLYEGPCLTGDWDKNYIFFYRSKNQDVPELSRPYLNTKFETQNPVTHNEEDEQYRMHPYPKILALGILLLEIELGEPLILDQLLDNLDAAIPVALKMLEACEGRSLEPFIKAIKACLALKTFDSGSTFGDEKFREEVYKSIILPLETALLVGYGVRVEDIDTLSLNSKLLSFNPSLAQEHPIRRSSVAAPSSHRPLAARDLPILPSTADSNSPQQPQLAESTDVTTTEVCLFDNGEPALADIQGQVKSIIFH